MNLFKQIIFLASFMILLVVRTNGQTDSSNENMRDVHYDVDTENYFSEYKNSKLIANYYCSRGLTERDRYSYEVIVIDSVLMCGFDSPETESMSYISYQKKQMLTPDQKHELKAMLDSCHLKQLKIGIPRPDVAANTKEVIIVNYNGEKIQGGMIHYHLQDEMSPQKRFEEEAKERKQTSSIGGNYDAFINLMKDFFADLQNLELQAVKAK